MYGCVCAWASGGRTGGGQEGAFALRAFEILNIRYFLSLFGSFKSVLGYYLISFQYDQLGTFKMTNRVKA